MTHTITDSAVSATANMASMASAITTSSSSPVLSEVFMALVLAGLSVGVLLMLRYYLPLRTTPAFYLVPIFLALWLPASIVLLVPIDLASSAAEDDEAARGVWLPEGLLLALWKVTYWLTFALTWFILPVLGEYADSGYREPRDRLLYSLRSNAQYHAMVFGAGFVGLIYVFVSYGVSLHALKGLIMALAYFWGLALAIYLMGHGLVSMPRRLLRNAGIAGRLRRLQSRAPRVHEQMEDAIMSLEDVEAQVAELSRRKVGSARDVRDWIEELAEMANLPEAQPGARRQHPHVMAAVGVESRVLPTVITEKYLADLTRQLVRARHTRSRRVNDWNRLVDEAAATQAILDSAPSRRLEPDLSAFDDDSRPAIWNRITILTPYTRYLLHYHALPWARVALGGVLGMASVLIVWSEVVKVAFPGLSVVQLSVVHHWDGDRPRVGFAGQVIAACWILYMCAAALGAVTEVKVWRGRALVRRNTAHESAFWYASQVARLSIPLAYNFMTFLSPSVHSRTTFFGFLGQFVNLTPLGSLLDTLFPVFILVPVCATLFGLYGRVKRMFGFGLLDPIDEDDRDNGNDGDDDGFGIWGSGSWREGRDLIERELGGDSTVRRREEAFARLAVAANRSGGGGGGGVGSGGGANRTSAPVLSIPSRTTASPGVGPQRSPAAPSSSMTPLGARRPHQHQRTAPGPIYTDDEDDDENILFVLGHRMRNTIDSIETPQWLQEIGQGIKKPAWMGGDEEEGGGSTDIRRWFGGGGGGSSGGGSGTGEGRIRLL